MLVKDNPQDGKASDCLQEGGGVKHEAYLCLRLAVTISSADLPTLRAFEALESHIYRMSVYHSISLDDTSNN